MKLKFVKPNYLQNEIVSVNTEYENFAILVISIQANFIFDSQVRRYLGVHGILKQHDW